VEPLAAAALLFCSTAQPGPYPSASVVIDAWDAAYSAGDAKAAAALITAEAVIVRGDQQLKGDELIKNYRDNLFTMTPLNRVKVINRLAQDDLVAQTERYSREGDEPETMLSFYRVDHGCIVSMAASQPDKTSED
jgi:predicted SnoaL-like aldol condensation-catalyzing enzyme